MKRSLFERWYTALTDGSYRQARRQLRLGDGYCCLGVFADVAQPEEWDGWAFRFADSTHYDSINLPDVIADRFEVPRWAAAVLPNLNDRGFVPEELRHHHAIPAEVDEVLPHGHLLQHTSSPWRFEQIAQFLREHEALFVTEEDT